MNRIGCISNNDQLICSIDQNTIKPLSDLKLLLYIQYSIPFCHYLGFPNKEKKSPDFSPLLSLGGDSCIFKKYIMIVLRLKSHRSCAVFSGSFRKLKQHSLANNLTVK